MNRRSDRRKPEPPDSGFDHRSGFLNYICRSTVKKAFHLHPLDCSPEHVNDFSTFFWHYSDVSDFLHQVAVYSEFRRDWPEALKFYEEGVRVLREV